MSRFQVNKFLKNIYSLEETHMIASLGRRKPAPIKTCRASFYPWNKILSFINFSIFYIFLHFFRLFFDTILLNAIVLQKLNLNKNFSNITHLVFESFVHIFLFYYANYCGIFCSY